MKQVSFTVEEQRGSKSQKNDVRYPLTVPNSPQTVEHREVGI